MKYYLAGKIWQNDWRTQLLGHRGGAISEVGCQCEDADSFRLQHTLWELPDFCDHSAAKYAGPFFISCDHGCYHGDNRHGQLSWGTPNIHTDRNFVAWACFQWIDNADVVIARISDDNPTGTLVEVGYAFAKGKPVYLWEHGTAKKVHWFPFAYVESIWLGSGDDKQLATAIRALVQTLETESGKITAPERTRFSGLSYKELLALPEWQKKRLEILNLRGWACQTCGDTKNQLHIHHRRYARGCLPWEYDDENFAVLCDFCHKRQHAKK